MGNYTKNAALTILKQFKVYIKNSKKNNILVDDIEYQLIFDECTHQERMYFINIFNEIIRDTCRQFLTVPTYLRPYYCEFFADKMNKKFNKRFKKLPKTKFSVNIETLLKEFIKNTITCDWRKIIRNYQKLSGLAKDFIIISDTYTLDKIKNNKIK